MANNPHLADDGKPYQFTSKRQPPNAGRKPSRLKKYIKDNNLSSIDVSIIARLLLNKSREEIQKLLADPKVPILIAGAAAALLKDMARGRTDTLQWLADRGVGKTPEKTIAVTEDLTAMGPEERDAEIERFYKDYQDSVRRSSDATTGPSDGDAGESEKADKKEHGTSKGPDHD